MKPINDSQTETGVKDKMCSVIISRTVQKFQEERQKKDRLPSVEISRKLLKGLLETEAQCINPLLTMPGKHCNDFNASQAHKI